MGNKSLDSVLLVITDYCEHKCPICYASSEQQKNGKEHGNIDVLLRIISQLSKSTVKTVILEGGDPALHPSLNEIAYYINDNTNMQLIIQSNTLNFKGIKVENVPSLFSALETTIHSDTSIGHNLFCGKKDAYQNLVDQLITFSQLGVEIGIDINLTSSTYNKLFDILHNLVIKGIDISYSLIQRVVPFGQARRNGFCQYKLNKEMIECAATDIQKIENLLGIKVTYEDTIPICVSEKSLHRKMTECPCGNSRLSIHYDGTIYRCATDNRSAIGNILTDDIMTIWENSAELCRFRNKEYLSPKCHSCVHLKVCGGGCPLAHENEKVLLDVDYLAF